MTLLADRDEKLSSIDFFDVEYTLRSPLDLVAHRMLRCRTGGPIWSRNGREGGLGGGLGCSANERMSCYGKKELPQLLEHHAAKEEGSTWHINESSNVTRNKREIFTMACIGEALL